jgi:hypothetical protein
MMRVYFYAPSTSQQSLTSAYEAITDVCQRADAVLSTNAQPNLPPETLSQHQQSAAPLLDAMQAMVVEGSTPDPQAGYLLAYAIAEKRPLLYLYARGEVAPEVLRYLNLKDIPKHVVVTTYTPANLERTVEEFLKRFGKVKIREVPRIKFTLRLTPTIDEYLDFKTRNTKKTKADYLRDKLDKLLEDDDEFQQYLRKRSRG